MSERASVSTEPVAEPCRNELVSRCLRPAGHKGFCSANPSAFTPHEIEAMRECPLALQSVINWHHVQEAEGDAMGGDVSGNEARRKELEARRDAILAESGEPAGDLRWTSKPFSPEPAPAPATEPVSLIEKLRDQAKYGYHDRGSSSPALMNEAADSLEAARESLAELIGSVIRRVYGTTAFELETGFLGQISQLDNIVAGLLTRSAPEPSANVGLMQAAIQVDQETIRLATALLDKMEAVFAHPAYQSVWQLHQIHNGPYSGPSFGPELNALRDRLCPPETKAGGA